MSTLKVNKVESKGSGGDAQHLEFAANGSTYMQLTSAGSLSAQSLSATQFWGDGSKLSNLPGGGKLLQIVSATVDTQSTTTNTSLTNTAVTASITPSSASSKVFVTVTFTAGSDSSENNIMGFGLRRDSTDIGISTTATGSRVNVTTGPGKTGNNFLGSATISHLDSPSTTSATTYYLTFLARSGYTTHINKTGSDGNNSYTYRGSSTITLMEIAG